MNKILFIITGSIASSRCKEIIYELNKKKFKVSCILTKEAKKYIEVSEIKKLLNWLEFSWDENYLKPYKNKQGFFTASNVQVRSPINNKSVGGWRKYTNLLNESLQVFEDNNFALDSFENFD